MQHRRKIRRLRFENLETRCTPAIIGVYGADATNQITIDRVQYTNPDDPNDHYDKIEVDRIGNGPDDGLTIYNTRDFSGVSVIAGSAISVRATELPMSWSLRVDSSGGANSTTLDIRTKTQTMDDFPASVTFISRVGKNDYVNLSDEKSQFSHNFLIKKDVVLRDGKAVIHMEDVDGCNLAAGSGNDNFTVLSMGMLGGSIGAGDGNDTLRVTPETEKLADAKVSFFGGEGNDIVTLFDGKNAQLNPHYTLKPSYLNDRFFDCDTLTLHASDANNSFLIQGVEANTTVIAGEGNDYFDVQGGFDTFKDQIHLIAC